MHTFGKAPSEVSKASSKASGEKVLVKALTALVNREGNKKIRSRRIELQSWEFPWI
jgi:hypothetical protein